MTKARKQKTAVTVISKIAERCKTSDACLIVIYGEELGRKFSLGQGQITIGRSAKCDVQIDQEAISRQHAKIVNAFGETVVSDLGSTNGTYVNDDLVDQRVLADGDLIKVGRTILKYLSGENIERAYYEEIYRLTTYDGLTQLHNRRYLLEILEREIFRARRYDRNLAVAVFAVDEFSAINHAFGHLAGDAVLTQLARIVKQNSRREDIPARLETELFAVVLPEIDLGGARIYCERIRELVDQAVFEFEGAEIQVTISIGVVNLQPESDAEGLITAAHERLRLAQQRGGNRLS